VVREKMRSSERFLLVGNRNGIQPQKNFALIPLCSTRNTKEMGGINLSASWATPSSITNRMVGNPTKLQDGVPIITKVTDVMMPWETGEYF